MAWIAESARQRARALPLSSPLLSSRSNLLPLSLLSLWSRGRRNQERKRAGVNEDARESREGEEAALSHSVTRSLSRSLSVNANKAGERASLGVCDSAELRRTAVLQIVAVTTATGIGQKETAITSLPPSTRSTSASVPSLIIEFGMGQGMEKPPNGEVRIGRGSDRGLA